MRTPSLLVSLLLLALAPACKSGEGEGNGEGAGASESESGGVSERTVEEWIELCESQLGSNDCDAVPAGMRGAEAWHCEDVTLLQASPDSEPACLISVTDSRCFAVSDSPSPEPGYIFTDPVSMQTWLIEPPPNTTVYGSAVEPCVLSGGGVNWAPDPMCACAGQSFDETG